MKAKKESTTKPSNQQGSEPETEENDELAGETQLSETSSIPENTKLPLIPPQYHLEHEQQPQPQPQPIFYSENGGQNHLSKPF